MAFDQEIKDDLFKDKELLTFIQEQGCREDFTFMKLKNSCQQYLFILTNEQEIKITKNSNQDEQHIMISYNSASREMCLKIKEILEKANHKVWIDVYEINGKLLK